MFIGALSLRECELVDAFLKITEKVGSFGVMPSLLFKKEQLPADGINKEFKFVNG
jgi:hypothetical protein